MMSDFARFHFADEFGVHEIEGARFRSEDVSAIELAERERAEAKRIAHAHDFAFAHDDEAEGAFQPAQHAERTAPILERLREQMRDDLAVGCGLENGTFALQLVAQDGGVDQIAIVRDRDLPAEAIDHERLRILQNARASRRITRVPDRARSFQALQFLRAENLRDEPHVAVQKKGRAAAVRSHDPGALLPAMLQREEAVIGQDSGVRVAEDRENAALVLRKHGAFRVFGEHRRIRGHLRDSQPVGRCVQRIVRRIRGSEFLPPNHRFAPRARWRETRGRAAPRSAS